MQIYNSLHKKKLPLKTIEDKKISLYVCGMTVYDFCHLGHGRVMLTFDMIVRFWRWLGFEVNYIRNITDIDDKIIDRANENKETTDALTTRFIEAMHEDTENLLTLTPDHEPRATAHMPQMIEMIERLIQNAHAYVGGNGDVFYEVRSFEGYGKLSHRNLDDMQAGARVETNENKRDHMDFVLWKIAKPGEPSWDSPWGAGRPGWHIECSAMSTHCLGKTFDIHGGGMDLMFPHHENEIAQAEGANRCGFANQWLHLGFLQIDKEKMSKSLGNFFTIRDVLEKYHAETIRYFMLSSHYRSPLNFSDEALHQSRQALSHLFIALRGVVITKHAPGRESAYYQRFIAAMEDDFNTPQALTVLFELAKEINCLKEKGDKAADSLAAILMDLGGSIGLFQTEPTTFLQDTRGTEVDKVVVEKLIQERVNARTNKEWARADSIREQLSSMNVVLEDGPEGTLYRVEVN
jgi:cysteinyl-tRNA synthetase